MSGFLRPEALAALRRWSEVLAGLLLAGVSALLLRAPGPAVQIVALAGLVAGAALALIGWRRLRFRGREQAPGVVSVDEGEIRYFGPVTGGSVALGALTEIRLRHDGAHRVWVLVAGDGGLLTIPHGAVGAEQLFDAFASLPGLGAERLLARLAAAGRAVDQGTETVWRRTTERALTGPR